ncbi:hypothetical protein SAMN05421803_117103 [Nocardiopsis flavescens]|uniref:Uncharacterized protein n=1 Tax=Nocardiopsis flavescens TaxID=758803 RepID=A0A1M6RGT9_9ACTN|nr:hypothetical protein SAMN05421803_117103 [Nocardiopsis flavescens]
MTEVRTLPAPIVPHGWGDIDTSVDNEVPELLSEDQLDRYVATVAELLRACGLTVDLDSSDPGNLEVYGAGSTMSLEVDIRDDRSAEWSISGGDELDPGTKALAMAAALARLLAPGDTDG